MSESVVQTESNQGPQVIYLKDYEVPSYLVDEIDLSFDLYESETLVTSHLRIRRNRFSINKTKNLLLNGEDLILESLRMNGKELSENDFQLSKEYLIIHQVPDNVELEIKTKIYPQKNTALSGLYKSNQTYCTQCESEGFRRITYFLDRPDVLSRFTTTITADKKKYPILLSNGNLIESGDKEKGRHWVKWHDPFNKPCYLFALVAGDLDVVEDQFTTQSQREISLRFFVEKGYADQTQHAIHSLKEAMRWDEKTYGREYDLDIYMIVAISDFNMGAMENKGLNIFNTKFILAKPETATDNDYIHILSVIGHEYFHNWSGNRVTCRDWFQISLKEGLTIFRDQTFSEDLLSSSVMRIHEVNALRETQFPEDAGPLAHAVRPESYIEINNFYTATVYNKGAEIIRMIQTILGKDLFRKGMDLYFARHDGQAVTIEDYVKAMEDVSGIDLRQFRLWYSQAGTPILHVEEDYDSEQKIYSLTISQKTLSMHKQENKKPLYVPIKMGLLDRTGQDIPLHINNEPVSVEKILHLTQASQVFQFHQIASHPIPSLLRNFSAPVKLNYSCSDANLQFLFMHDKDAFSRWDAGQKYTTRLLLNFVKDYQQEKAMHFPRELTTMFSHILKHNHMDQFLLAEMLTIPSEKMIGEQMEMIDVDAIHAAREFLIKELAHQLQDVLLNTYQSCHDDDKSYESYEFTIKQIGRRQLKNRCLQYLMVLPAYIELGMQQFSAAINKNMTDTQAALKALVNCDSPLRITALNQFYATWKHDALVVDKWLAIQAGSKLPDTLQNVKKLMRHEAFDIKNPNKVYALIGTFSYHNPVHFHALNGEGYAFLREAVHQLDKLNPQVAGRMAKPLTSFRKYDKERQALMQKQLEMLLQDKNISKDLYEIVSKSLG